MLSSLLILATAFQIGPLYEQKPDYVAARPLFSQEGEVTDALWPVFTAHRDWWRFCYVLDYKAHTTDDGYQFSVVPIWFNGEDKNYGTYAGLFPILGNHPHVLFMYDVRFCLWPLWMNYKMPRPSQKEWMETTSVLWPFISWRSDGAWSFWPFYCLNKRRESVAQAALWPIVTWANYDEDRDTAGAGYSWMVWPLYGQVRRARETQDMWIPPFFSYAQTASHNNLPPRSRLRILWPFFEHEKGPTRERWSFWPLYETDTTYAYRTGAATSKVTRFGWKFIELYDDETRVFPFYASGRNHFRLWPLWESETEPETQITRGRFLALFPIRWVPAIDRNWAKFWTLYETESLPSGQTNHALFWGLIRWTTGAERAVEE